MDMGQQTLSMEELRAEIKSVMLEWFSLNLSDKAVDYLLAQKRIKEELFKWGFHPGDTQTRDKMSAELTKRVVIRDWPLIGEGLTNEQMDKYVDTLKSELRKIGFLE